MLNVHLDGRLLATHIMDAPLDEAKARAAAIRAWFLRDGGAGFTFKLHTVPWDSMTDAHWTSPALTAPPVDGMDDVIELENDNARIYKKNW